MKPCDKSGDEYKPLLPANSLPRDIWPNKENFWKNSSFPCCDLCEILNGKDPGGMLVGNFELNP